MAVTIWSSAGMAAGSRVGLQGVGAKARFETGTVMRFGRVPGMTATSQVRLSRRGTVMAMGILFVGQPFDLGDDQVERRNDGGFEGGAVGGGREGSVDAADGRVEIVEALVGDLGGDFGS